MYLHSTVHPSLAIIFEGVLTIVILVVSRFDLEGSISVLLASVPGHCFL